MTLWTAAGFPKPHLREGKLLPPVEPTTAGATEDLQQYLRHLPSGPYLDNDGYHAWTDGSVRTGCKTAGAGVWVRTDENPAIAPVSRSIGGEPVIIRGEMGALILALNNLPQNQPATLYTDSLSSLWIIKRWIRQDFGYCLDEEGHPDLVRQLVSALHRRRGVRTDMVWVPAHTGEPGNEVADTWAKAGVDKSAPAFDRVCPDIEFWSPARNLINFLGWRAATTRWANHESWQITAQHLRATSKAISTQSLLRPDRARATLGKV